MKRILLATAAAAFIGTGAANACLVDSAGDNVVDSDGDNVNAGSNSCSITLDANVAFAQGSSVLTAAGKSALDAIDASNISTVTGYASEEGDAAYNQALSLARAQAVAAYLGLSGASVTGAGETTSFGADLASNRVVVLS